MKILISIFLLLLVSTSLAAQGGLPGSINESRRFDVDFNPASFSHQGSENLVGSELGFAVNIFDNLGIVGDVCAHVQRLNGATLTVATYEVGPRLYLRPSNRVTMFGHLLVGGSQIDASFLGISGTLVSGTAATAGGGIDVSITKSFAVRIIQVDYDLLTFQSIDARSHGFHLGAGIVFRFGEPTEQ